MTEWQLGMQAFREGRLREAVDRLQSALADNDLTVSAQARYETYAYLGAALYALGQPADAVTAFEMAFRLSPAPVPPEELTLNLAHAYLAAGRRQAAGETLHFLLAHAPGHVAARMLAQRLESVATEDAVSGFVLDASAESAQQYIRTLVFTQVPRGDDPAEVREALSQLEHYIRSLGQELRQAEDTIIHQEQEIQRYRQMEDAMVEHIVQMQLPSNPPEDASAPSLSPIEALFQHKPSK